MNKKRTVLTTYLSQIIVNIMIRIEVKTLQIGSRVTGVNDSELLFSIC